MFGSAPTHCTHTARECVLYCVAPRTFRRRRRPMATGEAAGFGAVLRRHRLAAGLSQEALAERAGLSVRGLSDLERGVRQAPYPATVARLADALSLDPEARATLVALARRDETSSPSPV